MSVFDWSPGDVGSPFDAELGPRWEVPIKTGPPAVPLLPFGCLLPSIVAYWLVLCLALRCMVLLRASFVLL